ncbi:MAG: heavy metal translocating P-type ATPase, partial [Telluria sp.]
ADLARSTEGWWVGVVALLAAVPVVTFSAWSFYRAGWRTVLAGVPGMDALVSLGVGASFLLSVWRLAIGSSDIYVDTATMLVIFLLCGRLIELYARRRNSVAVNALRRAAPETARVLGADGSASEVSVEEAKVGDLVLVHAGERVPLDGEVVSGESALDRALVSGESTPVRTGPGDLIEAGCVNLSCPVTIRVVRPYGDRFIDRIGMRMLELFGAKSAVALQAERFARALIPLALGLTVAVFFLAWWQSGDAAGALQRALSVLVAACPCAVGLALPIAYAASAASAARNGILFRDPASMEALAGAAEIQFDKTGTLTEGRLALAEVVTSGHAAHDVLRWAALAETGITHPIASAIRSAAEALDGAPAEPGTASRFGKGTLWQSADGTTSILVGSAAWLGEHGVALADVGSAVAYVGTRVEVARNGEWVGAVVLQDAVRPETRDALAALRHENVQLRLVTGDGEGPAHAVAEAVGMDASHVHASCRPEDKLDIVHDGRGPVVFVGDGINDALALAAADCGIAIRGASAAAVATAGVVIVSGGIDSVVKAWRHSQRTVRIVRQNLMFSMVYNAGILFMAAGGLVPPVAAAAAMLASSLSVLGNASRLSVFRG